MLWQLTEVSHARGGEGDRLLSFHARAYRIWPSLNSAKNVLDTSG